MDGTIRGRCQDCRSEQDDTVWMEQLEEGVRTVGVNKMIQREWNN